MKKNTAKATNLMPDLRSVIYFFVIPILALIAMESPLKIIVSQFISDKDHFYVSLIKGIFLPLLFVLAAYLRHKDGKKTELLKGLGLFLLSYLGLSLAAGVLNVFFSYHAVRGLFWYYLLSLIPYIYVKFEEIAGSLSKIAQSSGKLAAPYVTPFIDKVKNALKPLLKKITAYKIPYKSLQAPFAVLLIVAALAVNYFMFFGDYFGVIRVSELYPKGQTQTDSVIKAVFSYEVEPLLINKEDPKVFLIKPAIKGVYEFTDSKTIVFKPSGPLVPAVKYSLSVNTKAFASKSKIITGASTSFYAPGLAVETTNFYPEQDPISNRKDTLAGEILFNYPVSRAKLKEFIEVKKVLAIKDSKGMMEESKAQVSVENTQDKNRFLIKITGADSLDSRNYVVLTIKAGLPGDGFDSPMKQEYKQKIKMTREYSLKVLSAMSWHTEGKTSIALRFNIPVAAQEVKPHVKITRVQRYNYYDEEESGDEDTNAALNNFTVRADHNYAILDGNFTAGNRYRIDIDSGMLAITGESYYSDDNVYVNLENMPSGAHFAEEGEILTPGGNLTIPVRVVNQANVGVKIYKVEKDALQCFLDERSSSASHSGKLVFEHSKAITGYTLNKEFVEYIKLDNVDRFGGKGIYYIVLDGSGSRKTVNITDLGMIMKISGKKFEVSVISIKTLEPAAGSQVQLTAKNGSVIMKKTADINGKAVFNLDEKELAGRNPAYILAERNGDFSFMDLNSSVMSINNMNYDTDGEPNTPYGMKAFVTSDRGLYRPGDKVRLTAIIRNLDMSVPPHIFASWVVTGPTGETLEKAKTKLGKNGVAILEMKTSAYEKTGQYKADLYVNSNFIASDKFKIEEFIPDKIETIVKAEKKSYKAGDAMKFTVKANQLFGPPAAGNKVGAEVRFSKYIYENAKYPDYVFNDTEKEFNTEKEELGEDVLSAEGEKTYEKAIPAGMVPPSMLKAEFYAEVFDDGGRPVSGYNSSLVHIYDKYFGIMLPENRRGFKQGEEIPINLLSLDTAGNTTPAKAVHISVKRKMWYSIYRYNWWYYDSYESESYMDQVSDTYVDLKNGAGVYKLIPDAGGEYTVKAGYDNGMTTSVSFNVSGLGTNAGSNLSKADRSEIVLDKTRYSPGQTVNAVIKAPFDGTAIVYVEREKVFEEKRVNIKNGSGKISFTFKNEYFPNVYMTAMVIRKHDQKYLSMPFVSTGIRSVQGDLSARRITAKIISKSEVFSGNGIDVKVQLKNAGAGTSVMLTAVDEGILQIIRFLTPDPLESFYRKKALEVSTATMFNLLLSEVKADKQPIGGDFSEPARKHLNPIAAQIVKSFAKFSGILYPGLTGEVNYHFDTKDFNGKVRIMALMVDNEKMGSGEQYVQVTDPIVVMPHLPRFLAPGDTFQTTVGVYNNTGKSGNFKINIITSGPVKVSGGAMEVEIADKKEAKLVFKCAADAEPGKAIFTYMVSGNGIEKKNVMELPVRPAAHNQVTVFKGYLKPGEKTEVQIPQNTLKQGRDIKLNVSYSRIAECAGALKYLINYPYGCIEQTTSSTYPMIFFKGLGLLEGELKGQAGTVDSFVGAGIARLRQFQMADGRMSYWPGGGYEAPRYMLLYVASFLIEAKNRGYAVPDDLYKNVLDGAGVNESDVTAVLNGYSIKQKYDYYYGNMNKDRIYQLYLKGLAGKPDTQALEFLETLFVVYHKDEKTGEALAKSGYTKDDIEKIAGTAKDTYNNEMKSYANNMAGLLSETDKYFLSMAFSQVSNYKAAKLVAGRTFNTKYSQRELNDWLNSYNRNFAMYVKAIAEANNGYTEEVMIAEQELIKKLEKNGSFGSTQETAWALMALSSISRVNTKASGLQGEVAINGKVEKKLDGSTSTTLADTKGAWNTVGLKNTGNVVYYYSLLLEGVPKIKNTASSANGLSIGKSYYDENGAPISPANIKQGKLVVVTLRITPSEYRSLDNVIIDDMLPAGFEIENTRIRSHGMINFTPASTLEPAYTDIRDDRMLIFTRAFSGLQTYSYVVRAVTPGSFVVPNAYAEAMYDPSINAEAYESENLTVVP